MKPTIIQKRYNDLLEQLRKACEGNFAGTWQEQIKANTGPFNDLKQYEINCRKRIKKKQAWIDSVYKKLIAYRKQLGLPDGPLYKIEDKDIIGLTNE